MDEEKPENFLRDFVELCSGTEIPPQFAAWSGIAGVSAAMGRRCWIDMGTFMIFPNTYIILVAGSGLMRKGTSIGQIKRILKAQQPPPNLLSQKYSPEALIDALSKGDATGNRLLSPTSAGFIILDELSTFLNKTVYDAGMGALLTPLFDGDTTEYTTLGRGKQRIENPCLGILAAATYDWLSSSIPESAIGGGVTSRFIFVHEEVTPEPVPFPLWDEHKVILQEQCVKGLQRISLLEGPFSMDQEARSYYASEYINFRKSSYGREMFENKNLRGYASRRYVHQLKLGMLFSASEGASRVITKRHLEGSTRILQQTETALPKLYSLITSTEQGNLTQLLLSLIKSKGYITRQELMRAAGHKVGVREVASIIETLVAQGMVQELIEGSKQGYRFIGGKD
jgi:hypothetical protein